MALIKTRFSVSGKFYIIAEKIENDEWQKNLI